MAMESETALDRVAAKASCVTNRTESLNQMDTSPRNAYNAAQQACEIPSFSLPYCRGAHGEPVG